MNLANKISEHFTYGEVIGSKIADNLGMDNELPPEYFPKVELMARDVLEKVREHFKTPVIITSWYRCPALNQMISNNPDSQHTKGEAVDFKVKGVKDVDVVKYIYDNLVFDQLILERSWVHISLKDSSNRKEVLSCDDGRTYRKLKL